jgi:hypothetical protein
MGSTTLELPVVSPPSTRISAERELVVIVNRDAGLAVSPTGLSAARPVFLREFHGVLLKANAVLRPMFSTGEERLRFEASAAPPSAGPVKTPNLAGFYKVEAPEEQMETIANRLRRLDEVAAAYVVPPSALPQLNAMLPRAAAPGAKTPNFQSRQGYLNPAPGGVDAIHAWTIRGGKGNDVRIIDIEGAWRYSHEDLRQNKSGVVGGSPPNSVEWRNHGTAVIGEFSGDDNSFGVCGICPEADVASISIFPKLGSAEAIRLAAMRLRPGDIILIELHRPGPRYGFVDREDQAGFIPIEWWPHDLAVIRYAISRGIVVVEAGGNGGENLDDALYDKPQEGFPDNWVNPLRSKKVDSGSIVVGAGAPPPGTHNEDHGPDRSRLDFSNYGSRVDVQGWGREVTTCGYGDLQGGISEDIWYTDEFSGTSSASPIVVGVIGCLQGILRSRRKDPLTPAEVRTLLRTTGAPQTDAPGRPATQRIGNRPDLRQLVAALSAATAPKARPPKPSSKRSKASKPLRKPRARRKK